MTVEELKQVPGFRAFAMTEQSRICTPIAERWSTDLRQAMQARFVSLHGGASTWIYGIAAAIWRSNEAKNKM